MIDFVTDRAHRLAATIWCQFMLRIMLPVWTAGAWIWGKSDAYQERRANRLMGPNRPTWH